MAIDPRIPLMGKSSTAGNQLMNFALNQQQVAQQEKQNVRADQQLDLQKQQFDLTKQNSGLENQVRQEQLARLKFDNLSAREQSRLKDITLGSAELGTYLNSEDFAGAEQFLINRKKRLGERIAKGEDVNTSDTDVALRLIKEDPEKLKKVVSENMRLGQQLGFIGGNDSKLPSSVQEYQFFNNLDPDQQKQFLNVKRQILVPGQSIDSQGNVSTLGGFEESQASIEANKAEAKKRGEIEGDVLPEKIQLKQDELIDEISLAQGISTRLNNFTDQIDTGELDLGVIDNLRNKVANNISMSSEESRNLASFDATLEKLRNDTLRLNKGVQTEGDAQRAMNELLKSINDPQLVKQRLTEIAAINDKAARIKEARLQLLREENRKLPLDVQKVTGAGDNKAGGGQEIDFNDLPD